MRETDDIDAVDIPEELEVQLHILIPGGIRLFKTSFVVSRWEAIVLAHTIIKRKDVELRPCGIRELNDPKTGGN